MSLRETILISGNPKSIYPCITNLYAGPVSAYESEFWEERLELQNKDYMTVYGWAKVYQNEKKELGYWIFSSYKAKRGKHD